MINFLHDIIVQPRKMNIYPAQSSLRVTLRELTTNALLLGVRLNSQSLKSSFFISPRTLKGVKKRTFRKSPSGDLGVKVEYCRTSLLLHKVFVGKLCYLRVTRREL